MEPVSMNDGLEGRDPIAFGLAAGELVVFVGSLMTAYVVLQGGLPGALAWTVAVALVLVGAALAWGRLSGRALADWAVLLAAYAIRTRGRRLGALRARGRRLAASTRRQLRRRGGGGHAQAGALVIPLARRRPEPGAALVATRSPESGAVHVVSFFSLNGGTGRTTLAVGVASLLAARSAAARACGRAGVGVGLIDLTTRSPGVALRIGLPLPMAAGSRRPGGASLRRHDNGLLVAPGPFDGGGDPAGAVRAAIEAAAARGCAVLVLDIDCDLGDVCRAALLRSDRVLVTVTGDPGGVLDAYRSTAVLRRLGLRDRLDYVVNRGRGHVDLTEVMGDLGGRVIAQVPEHRALSQAGIRLPLAGRAAGSDGSPLGRLAADVGDTVLARVGGRHRGTAG